MKKKALQKGIGIKRREFLRLSTTLAGVPFIATGTFYGDAQLDENEKLNQVNHTIKSCTMKQSQAFANLIQFPLVNALFGRRARRFGLGMEIPSGPLAYKSKKEPIPLSETEQMMLVAAATGVSGWNFGVPFGPQTPNSHAEFTLRFTGRTVPTAAGLGTPALFFTDDFGCYCTRTRDV